MKLNLFLIAAALLTCLTLQSSAQETEAVDFKDAPITDVLTWAQKDIGCGFIYEGADLIVDGKPRKITSERLTPKTKAEKTLALFELLKRAELVAFEVEGMPGPTYQLVKGAEAARYATVVKTMNEARKYYFAALSIKLMRADPAQAAEAVRRVLTEHVGSIEVFLPTHTLIVSDFSSRLQAAYETAQAADVPAEREDDLIIADLAPHTTTAKRAAAAMERLRSKGELWQVTVNESSNVLLISGRRDEVQRVSDRFARFESKPADAAYSESVETFKVVNVSAEDAARTLKSMFETEIAGGSVQIGAFEKQQKIVFRGGKQDALRAKEALKAIDAEPDAAPKEKK
jgi:type II secretory pathway component GspD/PulD (secretin)